MSEGFRIFTSRLLLFVGLTMGGEILAMVLTAALLPLAWVLTLVVSLEAFDWLETSSWPATVSGAVDLGALSSALAWLGISSALTFALTIVLHLIVVRPIVTAIVTGSCIDAASRIARGEAASWSRSFGEGLRLGSPILLSWVPILLMMGAVGWGWSEAIRLIGPGRMGAAVMVSFVGMSVGCAILIMTWLTAQAVVLERRGPLGAIARSLYLTSDHLLRIVGVWLLLWLGGIGLFLARLMAPVFGYGELAALFGTLALMTYANLNPVVATAYFLRWSGATTSRSLFPEPAFVASEFFQDADESGEAFDPSAGTPRPRDL